MSIQVKLVLPDNLNSSFLRGEFIESGATYVVNPSNPNPARDRNSTTLSFGFSLVDTATRLPVALQQVVSLSISNDPQFDPSATVTLTGLAFDPAKDTVVALDDNYFFGVSGHTNPEWSRSQVAGAGLFKVQNWPLSGNGGQSTVYFRAIVQAVGGGQGTYPEGYGVFDQILWQSEQASRPGQPILSTPTSGWTGRRSLWRFRASEEGQTGRFGSGVARYVGNIIEVRGGSVLSSRGPAPVSVMRTLAPQVAAIQMTTTGAALGTPVAVTNAAGVSVYGNETLATSSVLTYNGDGSAAPPRPDFGAQAHVRFGPNDSVSNVTISIRASQNGVQDEVVASVNFGDGIAPIATLVREIGGSVWQGRQQLCNLPDTAAAEIAAGGVIELYCSPQADSQMLAEAYFTPDSRPECAYLLASDLVPIWTGAGPWNLRVGLYAGAPVGSGTLFCDELACATGRFVLSADLGDCRTDDASPASFPTTITPSSVNSTWASAVGPFADWSAQNEGAGAATVTSASASAFTAPQLAGHRTVAELQAVMPTFSDRALLNVTLTHTSGEFYVAFSPKPVFSADRPMITRCDQYSGVVDDPLYAPTLAIVFNIGAGQVTAVQRQVDNTLTTRVLFPYTPIPSDNWSVQVSSVGPKDTADAAWVVIRRNGDVIGTQRMDNLLPPAIGGLGYYVALGTRSEPTDAYGLASVANLTFVSIYGLSPALGYGAQDYEGERHFAKETGGSAYVKPYLGQQMVAGRTDQGDYTFMAPDAAPAVFIQKVTVTKVSDFFDTVYPKLMEVKIRSRSGTLAPVPPQIRFYADKTETGQSLSHIDLMSPLTGWVTGTPLQPVAMSGFSAPGNDLVQFSLTGSGLAVTTPMSFWIALRLGAGTEAACANGLHLGLSEEIFSDVSSAYGLQIDAETRIDTEQGGNDFPLVAASRAAAVAPAVKGVPTPGTGWLLCDTLWFKLFTACAQRHDNVAHGASLQFRARAYSHASRSGLPSSLSTPVTVDLDGPDGSAFGTPGRPSIGQNVLPAVRTVTLTVHADDHDSGPLAFRVGRETDFGNVVYGAWQPWATFVQGGYPRYTIYNYGTRPEGRIGAPANAQGLLWMQNMDGDGQRKVWVQAMDAVGNVTESFPLTTLAQSVVLVDTTPPLGAAQFVSGSDGTLQPFQTNVNALLAVNGQDRVSGFKDFRLRSVGAGSTGAWSAWQDAQTYTTVALDGSKDGLKRVEAQVRDYGNNAAQDKPLWDILSSFSTRGLTAVASATWQSPQDAQEALYISAIRTQSFTNTLLVDSQDASYAGGTAFFASSQDTASVGRRILIRSGDQAVVRINGQSTSSFTLDGDRGLIVLSSPQSSGTVITADITRNSAQIYRWDGLAVVRVADLGYYGERVLLCLCATTGFLYCGGGSGNVWKFDGLDVTGPVFTAVASGPVPVSSLHQHRFSHESEPSLYAATANVPRLFRAISREADQPAAWAPVATTGFLASSSGDVTCMTSAYDTLFLGTNSGQIARYSRRLSSVGDGSEAETLSASSLQGKEVGFGEGATLLVASLCASGDLVIAGIGDRPEVWSYYQRALPLPRRPEEWSSQVFDSGFIADPAPWQYYNGGVTNTRTTSGIGTNLAAQSMSSPDSESGFRPLITVSGTSNEITSLTLGPGSDWEQALSGQTAWTLETEMMTISGSGKQGLTLRDGRYQLDLRLDANSVTVRSGGNVAQAVLSQPVQETFSALSAAIVPEIGGPVYPVRGVKRIWNFSATSQEDHGPYFPGGPYSSVASGTPGGSTQGWLADLFTVPGTAGAAGVTYQETETEASFIETTTYLRVTPMPAGDPRIVLNAITPGVPVNTGTRILVRARVSQAASLAGATLRVTWSEGASVNTRTARWTEEPLRQTDGFSTYAFTPTWSGNVHSLAIEVRGLPENSFSFTRSPIDIDYVAVAGDLSKTSLADNLTPVRVSVDGTRVRVWVGGGEFPIIDNATLLTLPALDTSVRIGKLDLAEPDSQWGWGGIRFTVGASVPPVIQEVHDFSLLWRFPSTGGVRRVLNHKGTAWAITDGLYNRSHKGDSPDDHAMKCWSYVSEIETWRQEADAVPRKAGGLSIIRPLSASSYLGTLVVSGQQGSVLHQ